MATWQSIEDTVERLSILQRNSPSAPERAVIVEEWAVTFAHVPDVDFAAAARRARLKTPFFPAEHDIGRELRLMRDERRARARQDSQHSGQALPMGRPSPEYLDKVRRNVAAIMARVRANMAEQPKAARSAKA
ncbi:hypothetical protein [Desulfocurvibacter africanus]|uniref:hypothetical protein n=1 Tax=Desulfocurvibacter africanus TaxID=873 RepID=UPI00059B7D6D|nr:hypothetical protein [Desulfocurvibacter africanus]